MPVEIVRSGKNIRVSLDHPAGPDLMYHETTLSLPAVKPVKDGRTVRLEAN